MIKILFYFTILLITYTTLLSVVKLDVVFSVNQNQANQIKLEELAFQKRTCSAILVGSSILSRFENPYLPEGYCNFALGGDSALTGLETLKRLNINPQKLIIEVNALRETNKELLQQVFEEPYFTLKKYFLILRSYHQPATVFYTLIRSIKTKLQFTENYNETVFQAQLKYQLEARAKVEFSIDLLKQAKEHANYFSAAGTKVTFIEIPIAKELEDQPLMTKYHQAIKDAGIYFERVNCPTAQTSDAIHLTPASVKECSSLISKI